MKKYIAIISLIAFGLTIYINFLSGTGQINEISAGGVSGLYPTLFTPAGFTFSIWSIIYLFLLGFVIFQIVKTFRNPEALNFNLNLTFIISCILNLTWIFAWHYLNLILSMILMLGLLASLVRCYLIAKNEPFNPGNFLLQKTAFATYLAWICVATIANGSILLVSSGIEAYGITQSVISSIMILIATGLAIYFLTKMRETVFQFVIIWAFYGIYSARIVESYPGSNLTATVSLVGIIIISIVFLASRFFKITASKTP